MWHDCGFQTYAERVDGEPNEPPVATILYFDGDLGRALDGDIGKLDMEFAQLLEQQGYWYERYDSVSAYIYPADDNPLFQPIRDYADWKWICSLVKPDIADIHEELFSYFAKSPEKLRHLQWRDFETLLFRIFQNQGFTCELGPGSNDGGIDVRLLQRDPLGDILTLVQAKKYAEGRKINLSAVAALHGVADVENAQRTIFVTTSEYLPSARKFAGRTSIPMTLATSEDVREWCQAATNGIIRDKSKLVTPSALSRCLQSLSQKDPRVVHARTGYSMIMNQFGLVLKETKYAALIMALPSRKISDDGYGQMGFEIPETGPACQTMLNAETVFRAKRTVHDGRVSYWDGSNLYYAWDGEAAHFSYVD